MDNDPLSALIPNGSAQIAAVLGTSVVLKQIPLGAAAVLGYSNIFPDSRMASALDDWGLGFLIFGSRDSEDDSGVDPAPSLPDPDPIDIPDDPIDIPDEPSFSDWLNDILAQPITTEYVYDKDVNHTRLLMDLETSDGGVRAVHLEVFYPEEQTWYSVNVQTLVALWYRGFHVKLMDPESIRSYDDAEQAFLVAFGESLEQSLLRAATGQSAHISPTAYVISLPVVYDRNSIVDGTFPIVDIQPEQENATKGFTVLVEAGPPEDPGRYASVSGRYNSTITVKVPIRVVRGIYTDYPVGNPPNVTKGELYDGLAQGQPITVQSLWNFIHVFHEYPNNSRPTKVGPYPIPRALVNSSDLLRWIDSAVIRESDEFKERVSLELTYTINPGDPR
jgi:hypothetical protein